MGMYEKIETTLNEINESAENSSVMLPLIEGPGHLKVIAEIGSNMINIALATQNVLKMLSQYLKGTEENNDQEQKQERTED